MGWPSHYTRFRALASLVISSGTNTSFTANKLVDSGATFITNNIQVGDHVKNTFDATSATVTAVDSETTLSLSGDIFPGAVSSRIGTSTKGKSLGTDTPFITVTSPSWAVTLRTVIIRNRIVKYLKLN